MKSINVRLDEKMLDDLKKVAKVYEVNYSDLIREGISNILQIKENDAYYKLVSGIEYMDEEEEKEITALLQSMADDDLEIVEKKEFKL